MYGAGMPILFPIAALNYISIWLLERYNIAYSNQLPPSLDDKLQNNAIKMMRIAPLLFVCNGYWMLNNQQIFQSSVSLKATSDIPMTTGHNWTTLAQFNQSLPLFCMSIVGLTTFVLSTCFANKLRRWGMSLSS